MKLFLFVVFAMAIIIAVYGTTAIKVLQTALSPLFHF